MRRARQKKAAAGCQAQGTIALCCRGLSASVEHGGRQTPQWSRQGKQPMPQRPDKRASTLPHVRAGRHAVPRKPRDLEQLLSYGWITQWPHALMGGDKRMGQSNSLPDSHSIRASRCAHPATDSRP